MDVIDAQHKLDAMVSHKPLACKCTDVNYLASSLSENLYRISIIGNLSVCFILATEDILNMKY